MGETADSLGVDMHGGRYQTLLIRFPSVLRPPLPPPPILPSLLRPPSSYSPLSSSAAFFSFFSLPLLAFLLLLFSSSLPFVLPTVSLPLPYHPFPSPTALSPPLPSLASPSPPLPYTGDHNVPYRRQMTP